MTAREISDELARRAEWTASRSSGPGGQRRDHVETRVEMVLAAEDLAGLDEKLTTRLIAGLALDERPLRLRCGTERSRERNRGIVLDRLTERVVRALAPPAPPRRPTRPGTAARKRRLADKAHRATVKSQRRRPGADD
jgi:ribosome-associated protein